MSKKHLLEDENGKIIVTLWLPNEFQLNHQTQFEETEEFFGMWTIGKKEEPNKILIKLKTTDSKDKLSIQQGEIEIEQIPFSQLGIYAKIRVNSDMTVTIKKREPQKCTC